MNCTGRVMCTISAITDLFKVAISSHQVGLCKPSSPGSPSADVGRRPRRRSGAAKATKAISSTSFDSRRARPACIAHERCQRKEPSLTWRAKFLVVPPKTSAEIGGPPFWMASVTASPWSSAVSVIGVPLPCCTALPSRFDTAPLICRAAGGSDVVRSTRPWATTKHAFSRLVTPFLRKTPR
jgi:hypothetical protein